MPTSVSTVSDINALVHNTVKTTGSAKGEVVGSQPNIVAGDVVVDDGVLGGTPDAKVRVKHKKYNSSNISG
jgi:hypothetical protein